MSTILKDYLPPSRAQWELLVWGFSLMPYATVALWFRPLILMGKNSTNSLLNINGRFGWFIMEAPGFVTLWATMLGVKSQLGIQSLPKMNYLMASLYTIHYIYRSILSPVFLAPSVSPMHISVAVSALAFNIINGASIGGWLGGYGPTTSDYWSSRMIWIQFGLGLWIAGFAGNVWHDDELRELRRKAAREQQEKADSGGSDKKSVAKVYRVPEAGLFQYILYPHYLCEWIEWTGYCLMGGWTFQPGRSFLLNEIGTMAPQAKLGKKWYINRFGKEKIGDRKAVIPGIL